jgi:hypothetical protein
MSRSTFFPSRRWALQQPWDRGQGDCIRSRGRGEAFARGATRHSRTFMRMLRPYSPTNKANCRCDVIVPGQGPNPVEG